MIYLTKCECCKQRKTADLFEGSSINWPVCVWCRLQRANLSILKAHTLELKLRQRIRDERKMAWSLAKLKRLARAMNKKFVSTMEVEEYVGCTYSQRCNMQDFLRLRFKYPLRRSKYSSEQILQLYIHLYVTGMSRKEAADAMGIPSRNSVIRLDRDYIKPRMIHWYEQWKKHERARVRRSNIRPDADSLGITRGDDTDIHTSTGEVMVSLDSYRRTLVDVTD